MAKKQLGPTTNLFPMPAVLVAVKTGEHTANILTVAWCGIVGGNPPLMALEIGQSHYLHALHRGGRVLHRECAQQQPGRGRGLLRHGQRHDRPGQARHLRLDDGARQQDQRAVDRGMPAQPGVPHREEGGHRHGDVLPGGDPGDARGRSGVWPVPKKINAAALDPLIFTPDGFYHKLGERVAKAWDAGKALKKP